MVCSLRMYLDIVAELYSSLLVFEPFIPNVKSCCPFLKYAAADAVHEQPRE